MSIIEAAKAHRDAVPVREHLVPEWGSPGKPLVVYARSLSVAQRRKCWRTPSGEVVDGVIAAIRAVLFFAQDKAGNRLFDDMDEKALTHDVDGDVVTRIGGFILGFGPGGKVPSAEEQIEDAKND